MFGYIYEITNNINGMKYIGQHKSKKADDRYMGSGKILKQAQKKEGIENFSKRILEVCESYDELNEVEERWITETNAVYSSEYYNIAAGGSNCNKYAGRTEEEMAITKKKISDAGKGRAAWNKGIPSSEETKKKISESEKALNRHISDEQKLAISKANTGKNPYENKSKEEMIEISTKHSESIKGSKNGMYGNGYKLEGSKNGMYGKSAVKGKKFFNNGIKNIMAFECPVGFVPGKLGTVWNKGKKMTKEQKKKLSEAKKGTKLSKEQKEKIGKASKGKHWFNNGIIEVLCYVCPEGFSIGRLKSTKDKISKTLTK